MKKTIPEKKEKQLYKILIPGIFFVIIIMGFGAITGYKMTSKFSPLIHAVMEVKLTATDAHLWFEEAISGDRSIDINKVWEKLDEADSYAISMLEGGINPEGLYFPLTPLDNPELKTEIQSVREKLNNFRSIAQERYEPIMTGIGSEIDQKFDQVFLSFIEQINNVESKLWQIFKTHMQNNKYKDAAKAALFINSLMEIKLTTTDAHLWLEEVISGDGTVNIIEIRKKLDKADRLAAVMLEGGENRKGLIAQLDDPKLKAEIRSARETLRNFRELANERYGAVKTGVGSKFDQKFDKVFHSFIVQADHVEQKLRQEISKSLRNFMVSQIFLIFLALQ